jgi:hypothetical protein
VRRSRLLLAMLLFVLPFLNAEEIQLKDGTKITGKLVGIKDDVFDVTTAYGNIKVPRAQVVTISFENPPTASAGTSVSPIDESLTDTVYTNRTAGFRLITPTGWQLAPEMRKSNSEIAAALKSPDSTLYFLAMPESFAGTLATYEVLAENQYKNKFADYERISESEVQLDGHNAIRVVFQGKTDKATTLKCLVYLLAYQGRMVRLSFLTLEPLFNNAVPIFEQIAASYRSNTAQTQKQNSSPTAQLQHSTVPTQASPSSSPD